MKITKWFVKACCLPKWKVCLRSPIACSQAFSYIWSCNSCQERPCTLKPNVPPMIHYNNPMAISRGEGVQLRNSHQQLKEQQIKQQRSQFSGLRDFSGLEICCQTSSIRPALLRKELK